MNPASIIAACTELTYAYARLIDFRDYEGFAATVCSTWASR